MLRRILVLLFLASFHLVASAQNLYITNYTQKDYGMSGFGASPQNWDIELDTLGRVYIANSSGIMLFDGLTWQSVEGTENENMYSLSKAHDGTIFTGGRGEIGFIAIDSIGRTAFRSLTPLLADVGIQVENIESVISAGETVYFKNAQGIISWHDSAFSFTPLKLLNDKLELYRESVLAQMEDGTILSIRQNLIDTLFSARKSVPFKLVSIADISENESLLFTEENGIYRIIGGNINKDKSSKVLENEELRIECVINMEDQDLFAIATKGNGVLFMDYKGRKLENANVNSGLKSNTCYSIHKDKNNDLWASLDLGFSRIEYPSPLSLYDNTNSLYGIVNTAIFFEGSLYVGTTSGLYSLNKQKQFDELDLKSEIWDLKRIGGDLWIASTAGLFRLKNQRVSPIAEIDARTIHRSGNEKKHWVGTSAGLGFIEETAVDWKWSGNIDGIEHEVRYIANESDSVLWISFEKLTRLIVEPKTGAIRRVEPMNESNGFSEEFFVIESYSLKGKSVFGTGLGLYSYDSKNKTLVPDKMIGETFANTGRAAWALAEDVNGNIWLTSSRNNGKIEYQNGIVQQWDTIAFARLKDTDVWRIVPDEDRDFIYFCTTGGLYQFDESIRKNYQIDYSTLINRVQLNRDTVVSYLHTIDQKTQIASDFNDISFRYSATTFNFDEQILFSYKLDGYDDDWSVWDASSEKEYTNLPHGKYTFAVKAKNLYEVEASTAQYSFTILPPWYRTTMGVQYYNRHLSCWCVCCGSHTKKAPFQKTTGKDQVTAAQVGTGANDFQ